MPGQQIQVWSETWDLPRHTTPILFPSLCSATRLSCCLVSQGWISPCPLLIWHETQNFSRHCICWLLLRRVNVTFLIFFFFLRLTILFFLNKLCVKFWNWYCSLGVSDIYQTGSRTSQQDEYALKKDEYCIIQGCGLHNVANI